MNQYKGSGWGNHIRNIFSSISSHYDLMNTLMTFGRDKSWRHYVIQMADLSQASLLLDAGTGTGKIALDAIQDHPLVHVVATDFTLEMMQTGRRHIKGSKINWCCGDAVTLPFKDKTFDVVTSGFLVRNVYDIHKTFEEQLRVVKPGGRIVCLETCPPPHTIFRPFIMFYLKIIVPMLGGLISGRWNAYRYLPESTLAFKTVQELIDIMKSAGFEDINSRKLMFGTIGIVRGKRPQK